MSHPDADLLAGLALGEPVADEVRAHVAGCLPCRAEVEALAEAAGLLRTPVPELVAPPPDLRGRVLTAALAEPLPEVAAPLPAFGRRPSSKRSGSARGRFGAGWLVAAAAAGVLVGGLGVTALDREPPASDPVVLARADLATLDSGTTAGSADLVRKGSSTDLAVHAEALGAGDGYLEVWLINRDLARMVSIGVLEPGRSEQSFAVPAELVEQGYVIVDISREPFDDDARHSGDSLARGTLPV
ncbi:anti-sigma factor [Oryzobacter sp. R7]|uniref:anti-sigma factor n=1 Tax=Oryzobacter faecalis TaxID=3388656 RepID=UPI00398CF9D0